MAVASRQGFHRFALILCFGVASCAETAEIGNLPQPTPKTKKTTRTAPVKKDDEPLPPVTPDDPLPPPVPREKPLVNAGWVGGACESDDACTVGGTTCRSEALGFPGGMCSLDCDGKFCADTDAPGTTTTFCAEVNAATSPTCVSRCSFSDTDESRGFANSGCRDGYICATRPRYKDTSALADVCVPSTTDSLNGAITHCRKTYARAGNAYEAWKAPNESAGGAACTIADAMLLEPEVLGVPFLYNHTAANRLRVRCELAAALMKMVEIAKKMNVTQIDHLGTYNCRNISRSDRLSQHAYARAIDLSGFTLASGEHITVLEHWERGTDFPMTAKGQFLYELAHRLFDEKVFNIILTPDYNASHANHFHVDLTPASDFLGRDGEDRRIGTFDGEE
jgi:Extensin-like protein C-terminus